jgi:hypothetical protein
MERRRIGFEAFETGPIGLSGTSPNIYLARLYG